MARDLNKTFLVWIDANVPRSMVTGKVSMVLPLLQTADLEPVEEDELAHQRT